MLRPNLLPYYAFSFNNWGTNPTTTAGLSVVPGASNAEGSYTGHVLATAAQLTQDIYWLYLTVHSGGSTGQQKDHLLDIGVDPAGGTSYTTVIANVVCGETYGPSGIAQHFVFPIFIKAGSQVAVRIQGSNATAGTVIVAATFIGQPNNPEAAPVGMFSETIGTITNSAGQGFTPGNAADGTWQSLGTTAKAMWWWQLGYQVSAGTITAEQCFIDLAYGDGSNKHIILRGLNSSSTSEQVGALLPANLFAARCYCHVPAGATMYVRGRCNNAPDTGYNAVAIGIGG